jgi:hypothetical protein
VVGLLADLFYFLFAFFPPHLSQPSAKLGERNIISKWSRILPLSMISAMLIHYLGCLLVHFVIDFYRYMSRYPHGLHIDVVPGNEFSEMIIGTPSTHPGPGSY